MRTEFSCGALLYCIDNQQIIFLLLHYFSGHWDFPKGNKERGENYIETIRREIKEETGISDLNFIDGFVKEISYKYLRQNQLISKKVVYFLARTNSKDVVLSSEHTDFVWDHYENALKRLTYKKSKEILTEGYKFLKKL
ncbi:MAG TPA: NUDIX domain-containing protein [Nitrososphaeraceae archaeon]|nr:NUDIX domain-containing protein [Nitrososphaeraceae archaeon]